VLWAADVGGIGGFCDAGACDEEGTTLEAVVGSVITFGRIALVAAGVAALVTGVVVALRPRRP
jgi:hypothetical protein